MIDAILELRNIRRKHGTSFIGGNFDSDLCFSGEDSTIDEITGSINVEQRMSPAKDFMVSYFELATGDPEWVSADLLTMLRDRMSHMHGLAGKSHVVL